MKPNKWLVDDEFLSNVIFHNKYYFSMLCVQISDFIKNIPIPILTWWDYEHSQISFVVGIEKKAFKVDVNIAYRDYIFLIESWLKSFYPQYFISYTEEVPYSDKEILEKVKEKNLNLNDAILSKKKINCKEYGIIEKAYFKGDPEDTFRMNVNNDLSIRMSGNMDKPYPLSKFFRDFRNLKKESDKENFIFDNSIEIKKLKKKIRIEEINYMGMQMKNFVILRHESLKRCAFKKISIRKWKWGNFILYIETDILEHDILEFLKEKGIKIVE